MPEKESFQPRITPKDLGLDETRMLHFLDEDVYGSINNEEGLNKLRRQIGFASPGRVYKTYILESLNGTEVQEPIAEELIPGEKYSLMNRVRERKIKNLQFKGYWVLNEEKPIVTVIRLFYLEKRNLVFFLSSSNEEISRIISEKKS